MATVAINFRVVPERLFGARRSENVRIKGLSFCWMPAPDVSAARARDLTDFWLFHAVFVVFFLSFLLPYVPKVLESLSPRRSGLGCVRERSR
jgi:hypothetical protein